MKPVRWGVLGTSEHFLLRVYLPIQKSPLIKLYGIASRDERKAKTTAEKFCIPAFFGSYQALLEDPLIEAVFIPLPNHLHLEWIKKAAYAGKHILCEKPLAMNSDEVQEGIKYTKNKCVMLMEAFMYRFHPQWIRAWELARTGEIGKIRSVNTFFAYYLADPKNIRNILDKGGGGLMDIGCYAVSVARFILEKEPMRVVSLINRHPELKTDILSSAILDFGNAHSIFTVSTQTFPDQYVVIQGSSGKIIIHLPFNAYPDVPSRVTITNAVGTRKLYFGPEDQYALEFEAFSRAIREGREAPIPPEDALNNQKVIDALFRSEESGTWEIV